ncbi:hypothetical protein VK98_15900 [Chromobacterium sp. LK11]|uniref:DUF4936 family protein n=1 Tax=Chromobacterium sp. LK11 TaxID=1628212 RepID=UPI000652CC2B|nr:DUF4936 family protein [Chromobacterium sp. LK11]KMN79901.1 hypothetical protein VK98_15900 [Chromobacterium sp. LK11]
MSHSLYCYFKTDAGDAALLARLRTLQSALLTRTGVAGRLLRRRDDASTWMEVYEGISDADVFRRVWLEASAECGLAALSRHEEWFQPLN